MTPNNSEEYFRIGGLVVTSKEFKYIDPYDRCTRSYLFEEMESVETTGLEDSEDRYLKWYRGTLFLSVFLFFTTIVLNLLAGLELYLFIIYALISISCLLIWKNIGDTAPIYRIKCVMKDGTTFSLSNSPLERELIFGSKRRALLIKELAEAINYALRISDGLTSADKASLEIARFIKKYSKDKPRFFHTKNERQETTNDDEYINERGTRDLIKENDNSSSSNNIIIAILTSVIAAMIWFCIDRIFLKTL